MSSPDWRELSVALDHVQESGRAVPCREGTLTETRIWISPDASDQRRAAQKCSGCAAFSLCRDYAAGNPLAAGVLAGMTETDRRSLTKASNRTKRRRSA